jgi:antitoxin (DNA-binding transcriptional repressor) of toxin-antitoxin stability system
MRSNTAHLQLSEDIVPLSELGASAVDLMKKLRESGRAVVLTEEGRPAAVVIAAVERGRADLRAGRVIDDEDLAREFEACFGPAR